jgi:hypothetical protein
MKFLFYIVKEGKKGFVLPLTLMVSMVILTIATSISVILAKELYFSKLSRLSQVAYYAADNGIMCATIVDDQYIDPDTGIGIFEYNNLVSSQEVLNKINTQRAAREMTPIDLNDIKCANAEIFDNTFSNYVVGPFSRIDPEGNVEVGRTTTFNMTMPLGDGSRRCATVIINKTTTFRQVISRGFASCGTVFTYPIERSVVSTSNTLSNSTFSSGRTTSNTSVVLTSGSSWTVPSGITTVKVWAIGAGGGGAGAGGSNNSAGGGGGSGGVGYREFSVTPGEAISYAIGSGGAGGSGPQNGFDGQDTTVTISGQTIRGRGGTGGRYNNGSTGNGGSATGGSSQKIGGEGAGASGNMGGGGGGGLAGADGSANGCTGGSGGVSGDLQGFIAVVSGMGYTTVGPGQGGGCSADSPNGNHGSSANAFGNGGGGGGYYGGNGGAGRTGGGGGGAAGYDATSLAGGYGGGGAVVISGQ